MFSLQKKFFPGQPAAQNMQEMRWDDELAVRAQMWANVCTFAHDPSRYLGEFFFQFMHSITTFFISFPLNVNAKAFKKKLKGSSLNFYFTGCIHSCSFRNGFHFTCSKKINEINLKKIIK